MRILCSLSICLMCICCRIPSAAAETWCFFHYDDTPVYSCEHPWGGLMGSPICYDPDPYGPKGNDYYGGDSDFLIGNSIQYVAGYQNWELGADGNYGYFYHLYPTPIPVDGAPHYMAFTLTDDCLSLNYDGTISTVGGSSGASWRVRIGGNYAVCGSIVDGKLIADPYASFSSGRIVWAPETPNGYRSHLLLGYSFEGDNAPCYEDKYFGREPYPWEEESWYTYGTIVIENVTLGGYVRDYAKVNPHSFDIEYNVPEPSTLLAFLTGLAALPMAIRRRGR